MKRAIIHGRNREGLISRLKKAVTITALSCLLLMIGTIEIGVVMKRIIPCLAKPPLCACGCGLPVKLGHYGKTSFWNRYLNGHAARNHVASLAQRNAVSKWTIEYWTGRKHKTSSRTLMSIAHTGKIESETHKRNIGLSQLGHRPYWVGERSEAYRLAMSLCLRGENGPGWQGGISSLPYAKEWTPWLKQEIKDRDNHQCQNRHCKQIGGRVHVHHIDYDKLNCDPSNLICLCSHCHSKTLHNRDCWQRYLSHLIT